MKTVRLGLTYDDVLLVPQKTSLASRSEVDLTTHLTPNITLSLPIISANMDTVTHSTMAIAMAEAGGIGIIHRFLTIQDEVQHVREVKQKGLLVGAAIGIKDDYIDRAEALIKAGADVLVIDIAHGHSEHLIAALKQLKKKFKKTEFIAGNIVTAEAAEELIANGADGLKVGVGPGALCITRVVTGAGVPQITAIMDLCEVAHAKGIPVIADGGIRYSGDVVKALVAGASTVMMGTMLAPYQESPAQLIIKDEKHYKQIRGMASMKANLDRKERDASVAKDLSTYTPEGVEALVLAKGSVKEFITHYVGGIRSGFSYCGAKTLPELWQKGEFIQITQNALVESHPHDVQVNNT